MQSKRAEDKVIDPSIVNLYDDWVHNYDGYYTEDYIYDSRGGEIVFKALGPKHMCLFLETIGRAKYAGKLPSGKRVWSLRLRQVVGQEIPTEALRTYLETYRPSLVQRLRRVLQSLVKILRR